MKYELESSGQLYILLLGGPHVKDNTNFPLNSTYIKCLGITGTLTQIYFSTWIYEQFDQAEDVELGDVTDIEKNLVRKIVIVALWCIWMKPAICP
ncbi:hypothetical protein SLE2022_405220 [Rubroshorea leprosula]